MLEPLFEFFEKLVSQFTWRRLIFMIVLVLAVVTSLVVYESYTARFRLAKLEQIIRLVQLAERSTAAKDPVVRGHLTSALAHSAKELDSLSAGRATAFSLPTPWLKALAAFAPWTMLLIVFPLVPGSGTKQAIAAVFVLAIPCAVLGAFLPDFSYSWINYLAYPAASFTTLFLFVVMRHQVKQARARRRAS